MSAAAGRVEMEIGFSGSAGVTGVVVGAGAVTGNTVAGDGGVPGGVEAGALTGAVLTGVAAGGRFWGVAAGGTASGVCA